MAMSRKNYIAIANALYSAIELADSAIERNAIRDAAITIANSMRELNANFDRAKFYSAIGLNSYGEMTEAEYAKWNSKKEYSYKV